MQRAFHLLYEYQLERARYEPDALEHVVDFETVLEILHRVQQRRQMMDRKQDGQDHGTGINIIEYHDSPEMLQSAGSRHTEELLESAKRHYKEEHFRKQKMEIQQIREINQDRDAVHQEMDAFADRLIEKYHRRHLQHLQSAEVDHDGTQKVLKDEKSEMRMDSKPDDEWTDQQIKDLMNVRYRCLNSFFCFIFKLVFSENKMKYVSSKYISILQMTADYLYADWEQVLFGRDNSNYHEHQNREWRGKYPQWIFKQIEAVSNEETPSPTPEPTEGPTEESESTSILKFTEQPTNDINDVIDVHSIALSQNKNAPYNQDNDHLKQHNKMEDATSKKMQSMFRLQWNDLDPLQQHFLKNADHSELQSFLGDLDPKQHRVMEWMVFCHYHRVQCQGARFLPETFNKTFHFGHEFVWYDLNGWPRLKENKQSEAVQIEVARFHSIFERFEAAEMNEVSFQPTTERLQDTLLELMTVIDRANVNVIMVGMEHSPAHISRTDRLELECAVYSWIKSTLFDRGQKRGFVRLKRMAEDPIVPFAPCALLGGQPSF